MAISQALFGTGRLRMRQSLPLSRNTANGARRGPAASDLTKCHSPPEANLHFPGLRTTWYKFGTMKHTCTSLLLVALALASLVRADDEPHPAARWVKKQRLGSTCMRHPYHAFAVQFAPDGKTFLSAGGHWIIIWDARTYRRIRTMEEPNWIIHARYSPDGARIFSGSGYHCETNVSVTMWEAATGKQLWRVNDAHWEMVDNITFADAGKQAISFSTNRKMKHWDAETGRLLKETKVMPSWEDVVAFSPDGTKAILIKHSGTGRDSVIWDMSTLTLQGNTRTWPYLGRAAISTGGRIAAVVATPRNESAQLEIKIVDTATSAVKHTITPGPVERYACQGKGLTLSHDGSMLAAKWGTRICVWDTNTGKEIRTMPLLERYGNDLAFSPDGKRLLDAGASSVRIWDIGTGKQIDPAAEAPNEITCLASMPDGKTFFSGSNCGAVHRWTLTSETEPKRIIAPRAGERVRTLALTSDGTRLLMLTDRLQLHDTTSGGLLGVLKEDADMRCFVLSPNDRYILMLGELVQRIHVFDMKTREELCLNSTCSHGAAAGFSALHDQAFFTIGNDIALADIGSGRQISLSHLPQTARYPVFSHDGRAALHMTGGITMDYKITLYRLTAPASPEEAARLAVHVQALGAKRHSERVAAQRALEDAGEAAVDLLGPLVRDDDPEVRLRARNILDKIRNAVMIRPVADLNLPSDRMLFRATFDPYSQMWAGMLHDNAICEVGHVVVGSYSLNPGSISILAKFRTGETAHTLAFLPKCRGLLCGNHDGTITHFGPK